MNRITLNGRFLVQNITGVQRASREILKHLDLLATSGEIAVPRLLVPARGDIVAMPELKSIVIERVGRLGGHSWEQIELPFHCGTAPLLCLGNTAPILCLFRSAQPVITMVHDLSYKYFPTAYSWRFRALYSVLMPLVLQLSDRVVTVSRAERDAMSDAYPYLLGSDRFSALQNGGVPDDFAAKARTSDLPTADDRSHGLYVGSLTRRKNAEGMLKGAIAFLERHPDMRFIVIGGSGPSFEGVRLDIPEAVSDRLEFLGQVDDEERLFEAYKNARFLLFPSFYEASPLPPIEAMTFGCPVVSSRIASLVERCGDAAIYCDGDDPATIDAAIAEIMQSDAHWSAISEKSRTWTERYSWERQARGLLDLCEAVA